jgi:hypothetical protein
VGIKIEITDLHNMVAEELKNLIEYLLVVRASQEDEKSKYERTNNPVEVEEENGTLFTDYSVPATERYFRKKDAVVEKPLITDNPFLKHPDSIGFVDTKENPGDIELDTAGFPWDERIHAKNKSKKSDGTWRGGRGATPSKIRKIQNELREAGFGKVGAVESRPSNPLNLPPAPPGDRSGDTRFDDFMSQMLQLTLEKKITAKQIIAAVQSIGLKETLELNEKPHLISDVIKALGLK